MGTETFHLTSDQLKYNRRYGPPSEEVLRKLELSRQEVQSMKKRTVRCPICSFLVEGAYEDRSGHADIKCQRCKFEGTINLAYFRTVQNTRWIVHLRNQLQN